MSSTHPARSVKQINKDLQDALTSATSTLDGVIRDGLTNESLAKLTRYIVRAI